MNTQKKKILFVYNNRFSCFFGGRGVNRAVSFQRSWADLIIEMAVLVMPGPSHYCAVLKIAFYFTPLE